MKPIVLSALTLLLLAAPLNAQHAFFPLHVGDTWQYVQIVFGPNGGFGDVLETTVGSDTLMPNGYHYAVLCGWGWWGYMRQQGDSVFVWSPHGEWLCYDFTREPGDTTFTNAGQPGDTVFVITTVRDTLDTFGARRRIWWFRYDDPQMIDEERSFVVIDSIGVADIYLGFGGDYHFKGARVNGIVYGNLTSVEPSASPIPSGFRLEQNFPNPFNASTTIRYSLPRRSHMSLVVHNMLGQQVATLVNGEVDAGYHEARFAAGDVASGIYVCHLVAGSHNASGTMLLLR